MPAPLTVVYHGALDRMRARVVDVTTRAWDTLPDYRSPDRFVELVVPVVSAGQHHAAVLTDAYIAKAAEAAPVGVALSAIAPRLRGVPLEEVYARPFHDVWYGLSQGRDLGELVNAGRARAAAEASTDVLLAMRASADLVGRELPTVQGFTRVTETSGGCDLCQAVADEAYPNGGDMEIHPNCGCILEPSVEGSDQFNAQGSAPDLAATDTVVHDHGELGPVLANRGDEFSRE